jgi:hypothetical protein
LVTLWLGDRVIVHVLVVAALALVGPEMLWVRVTVSDAVAQLVTVLAMVSLTMAVLILGVARTVTVAHAVEVEAAPPWPAACAAAVTTIGAAATAATKTAL